MSTVNITSMILICPGTDSYENTWTFNYRGVRVQIVSFNKCSCVLTVGPQQPRVYMLSISVDLWFTLTLCTMFCQRQHPAEAPRSDSEAWRPLGLLFHQPGEAAHCPTCEGMRHVICLYGMYMVCTCICTLPYCRLTTQETTKCKDVKDFRLFLEEQLELEVWNPKVLHCLQHTGM